MKLTRQFRRFVARTFGPMEISAIFKKKDQKRLGYMPKTKTILVHQHCDLFYPLVGDPIGSAMN